MTQTPRAQLFRDAIDVIERRGWGKGFFYIASEEHPIVASGDPGDCPVCLWGALNVAVGNAADDWNGETENAIDFIGLFVLPSMHRPNNQLVMATGFNDAPETTKEDVIAALNRAAELCES